MVNKELLEKVGLTEGESKVYVALLEIGQSAITEIVKRAGVSMSKSYDILHRLEEKGLTSHVIIRGVKYFKAASPERLREILEEKHKDIEVTISKIDELIPNLIAKQKLREGDEEAEIFVGMKGLISVFNEETEWMEKTQGTSYVIGATKGGKAGIQIDEFFNRLQAKRDRLKLKTKFVSNENIRGAFPYLEKSKYCKIRYIEVGSEMTSINIFDDKIVISIYSKRPFLFVIKSKDVAKDFREYFEALWKKGKK
ncbi:helix-turn-helix domain-containing protein [Candidatus Woesearchaeota archaeon]|nr:helix-turn-helix domain-containing protein [Candidatus Woesearchaeota archaeon]